MRARSKEGKLQVELAQLEYLLPRLVGQGKTLSRLGGGIGTRGPGETKLETDRRHIRNKIFVKKELKEVETHRERNRQKEKIARFSDWTYWLHECREVNYLESIDTSGYLFERSIVCNVRSID